MFVFKVAEAKHVLPMHTAGMAMDCLDTVPLSSDYMGLGVGRPMAFRRLNPCAFIL